MPPYTSCFVIFIFNCVYACVSLWGCFHRSTAVLAGQKVSEAGATDGCELTEGGAGNSSPLLGQCVFLTAEPSL